MERAAWRDPRVGRITFGEWATEWLAGNPSKRATTLARDTVVLQTHVLPLLRDRPLVSITPAHIKGVLDAMASRLAPAMVRTNVGVIRAVFNAAVEADLITRSPVRGLRLHRTEPRERPTLTLEEILRLADTVGTPYRGLTLIGGVLGLRWSEAIGLRMCDVDFLRKTLTVPQFVLDELSVHLAREQRPGADLIFVGPKGAPLRRTFAARVFRPAVLEAGLDHRLTFHGLRHVAASLLVEVGEHPRVIQQRLGHARARLSMELYAHVPEAADREVASRLDAVYERQRLFSDDDQTGEPLR